MDLVYFIAGILIGGILTGIRCVKTIIEYKEKLANVIKLKDYYKDKCIDMQRKEK